MKTILIGCTGQLGSDIDKVFRTRENIDLISLSSKDIDVTNFNQVQKFIENTKPDLIINTAAFHQVDKCEEELELTFLVNTFAQKNICYVCSELNVKYVFISTDYVFSGDKNSPYNELDNTRPINTYGVSKLAGEQIIRFSLEKYFIIRVSGLYGSAGPSGKKFNFVDLMIDKARRGDKIKVVDDQTLTPTSTMDVASMLYELINLGEYGLYHLTNSGSCSWYEFALKIFELADMKAFIQPCKTGAFGEKAKRPKYSVLDNLHLRQQGHDDMRIWQDALKDYMSMTKII